jgi:predicted deacylase
MSQTIKVRPSTGFMTVDPDKQGSQSGYIRIPHSPHEDAWGVTQVPIGIISNGRGPTVILEGGNHGDEYEGQVALTNLAKSLDPARINGRVILLTMANYPAALAGRRVSPIDDLNLNRIFPGDPDGTVTRQIAHYIDSELIPLADFVMDLHSGGSSLNYVPCALATQSNDPTLFQKQLAALRAFGAPFTYIQGGAQGQGGNQTLGSGAERRGGRTTAAGGPLAAPTSCALCFTSATLTRRALSPPSAARPACAAPSSATLASRTGAGARASSCARTKWSRAACCA